MYYIKVYSENGQLCFSRRSHFPERCLIAYDKALFDGTDAVLSASHLGTVDTNIPDKYFELYFVGYHFKGGE